MGSLVIAASRSASRRREGRWPRNSERHRPTSLANGITAQRRDGVDTALAGSIKDDRPDKVCPRPGSKERRYRRDRSRRRPVTFHWFPAGSLFLHDGSLFDGWHVTLLAGHGDVYVLEIGVTRGGTLCSSCPSGTDDWQTLHGKRQLALAVRASVFVPARDNLEI